MPTLSMFYGIIVRMQSEKGVRHNEPHVHCFYGEKEVVMSLDGRILEGGFPTKQQKLVEAWIALHEDELLADWKLLYDGEGYFQIEPLR